MKGGICCIDARNSYCGLDSGLLLIRLIIGGLIALHGAGILVGGKEVRSVIGEMGLNGLIPPHIAGIIAGLFMLVGGVFVILGMFRRIGTFVLALVMLIATIAHFRLGHPIMGAGPSARHALDLFVIFTGLYLIGPGKFAICKECIAYTYKQCCSNSHSEGDTQQ